MSLAAMLDFHSQDMNPDISVGRIKRIRDVLI